jgi:chromosome segregation ATPase
MDQQYTRKIQGLKEEIEQVKTQRDSEIEKLKKSKAKVNQEEMNKLQNKFVHDINTLQSQVQEFKKKESELQEMIRLSKNQRSKINSLNENIRKIKSEEMQLKRKILLDHKSYQNWKNDKTRELKSIKQENSKKENQIKHLNRDLERLNALVGKKQSEINSMSKKNHDVTKKREDTNDMKKGIDAHVDLILMES